MKWVKPRPEVLLDTVRVGGEMSESPRLTVYGGETAAGDSCCPAALLPSNFEWLEML